MIGPMQGLDITGAIKYNLGKAGKLWRQEDLPWPLSFNVMNKFFIDVDSQMFVTVVAMFQNIHGLLPDGKLGPATYALMRSTPAIVFESVESHDFEGEQAGDDGEIEDDGERSIAIPPDREVIAPARTGVSNCLIIRSKKVMLPQEMLDLGITASNYLDDGEKHFDQHRKRGSVTHFVIHESVTMSAAQTNRVLDAKRRKSAKKGKNRGKGWDYGIHLNLAPDGHISCHADLVEHRLVQANQLNNESFGIEVVNPYNPKFGRGPFTEVIPGPWWCWKPQNGKKVYTLPTPAQMRAIYPLCKFLAEVVPGLPFEFPTADLNAKKGRIKDWRKGAKPDPGIVAHRDFASHADGRYLLEHVIEMAQQDG